MHIFLINMWILFVCAWYLMEFSSSGSLRYCSRYYACVSLNTKKTDRYFRETQNAKEIHFLYPLDFFKENFIVDKSTYLQYVTSAQNITEDNS